MQSFVSGVLDGIALSVLVNEVWGHRHGALKEIRAYLAARRLKLRDRGEPDSFKEDGEDVTWQHEFCGNELRIGIPKDGKKVHFCWRCEEIVRDEEEGDGGSTPPGEEMPVVEETRKTSAVTPLHKKAA